MIVKQPIILASILLWIGFVGAISFMEAWLKFRAPGITLPLGLGIGRIVFAALNKVEWVFTVIICVQLLLKSENFFSPTLLPFFIVVGILLIQTIWLLPALDARAEQHIKGEVVQPSFLHLYYVGLELSKMGGLIWFTFSQFKKI